MTLPVPNRLPLLPATLAAAAATVAVGSPALGAISYLTQMRIVEASVDAGNGDGMVDMERRVSMGFGDFDRTASAELTIGADPFSFGGDVSNVSPGRAIASTTQTSSIGQSGITATFAGDLRVGDDLIGRPTASLRNVLETTFVLDGPTAYEFFPAGRGGGFGLNSTAEGSLTANGEFIGPGIGFDTSVKFLGNLMLDPGDSLTGVLPGGEYTFRYVLTDSIPDDSESTFTGGTELILTELGDGGGTPAVIPLPGAATAGLLTLGGLGVARARRGRRA